MKHRGWAFRRALVIGAASVIATTAVASDSTPPDGDVDSSQALEMFLGEFGEHLRVDYDFDSGYPKEIYGRAMDLGWVPVSDQDYEDAARAIVDFYSPLFGYDGTVLALDKVKRLDLEQMGTTNKVVVTFDQVVDGMPVEQGSLSFIFSVNGEILNISNKAVPGVQQLDLVPAIDEDDAVALAEQAFDRDVAEMVALEIVVTRTANRTGPALAWNVELLAVEKDQGVPIKERISVDAHDGSILRRQSTVHTLSPTDVKGRVKGWASPGTSPDKGKNEIKYSLWKADIDTGVGDDDSNRSGYWSVNYGGSSNQSATSDFSSDSTWAYITSDVGNDLTKTKNNIVPGDRTTGRIVHNIKLKQKKTAQLNAHIQTTRLVDFINTIDSSDNTADFRHRLYTNIDSCCNAYYTGGTTNYYLAGCGCVNTAYSTVVHHEIGHHLNVLYNSGNGGDGFGEGNADNFAVHINDDPIVGRDFCGNGCHIRNAGNNRQYCNNSCGSGCYGGVHSDGEVLMGAMYKVRTRLNNSHGDAAGDLISNTLFIAWMNAYNDGDICENIRTHYLVLDDDNGNIDDGTPNGVDIDEGFKQQGFPGYY